MQELVEMILAETARLIAEVDIELAMMQAQIALMS
jgi:hypothetical protein